MSLRLPRDQRIRQLLDTAWALVRSEGTEAITLARVADRAGVSKPIAYRHFGSREGLLAALYRDFEDDQTEAMKRALSTRANSLEMTARVIATAYVDCATAAGPAVGPITAALAGSPDMERLLRECQERHRADMRNAFSPFVALNGAELETMLLGVAGAADAIAQAAADGRFGKQHAVSTLSDLMTRALGGDQATDG